MAGDRRRRPLAAIIGMPRRREVSPSVEEVAPLRRPRRMFGVTTILLSGFALLIVVGGGLLSLPVANAGEGFTAVETAFFTSTSAVTVTGHTVVNTPEFWSPSGRPSFLC